MDYHNFENPLYSEGRGAEDTSPNYHQTSQVGPRRGVAPHPQGRGVAPHPQGSLVPAPQGDVAQAPGNVNGGENVVTIPAEYDYIRLSQQVGGAGGGASGKTQDPDGVYESINTK